MDLSPFILKNSCECLNEDDDHPFSHCLEPKGGFLQSDCDEQVRLDSVCHGPLNAAPFLFQLIISVAFNQAVKIHSLKVKAPADKGPKRIKIFINQPKTLDFDLAESYTSVQDLE